MIKKLKLVLFLTLSTACFAVSAAPSGNAQAGKAKTETCKACHGADGNSTAAEFPRLAGQNADYLYIALVQYQTGKRKNPIMSAMVTALKPVDLADLAAYYASQKGLEVKY